MGAIDGKKTTPGIEPPVTDVSSKQSNDPKSPEITTVLIEMAWQVALPFMVFALGGNVLDTRYDTTPIFTLIGLFLAVASVSFLVYRLVSRYYPDTFGGNK